MYKRQGYLRHDSAKCGASIVVVPNQPEDEAYARQKADEIYDFVWARHREFHFTGYADEPEAAWEAMLKHPGNCLLYTSSYSSTVIPIVLGVFFMYYVQKVLKKIIPEALTFFLTPLITMIVVVPVTLIVLGPIGNQLSGYIAAFCIWLTNTLGFIAQPILSAIYPYMVMFGLDKGLSPIGIELIANLGYNSVTGIMGFVSNICIGGTALAVATTIKDNKAQKLSLIHI